MGIPTTWENNTLGNFFHLCERQKEEEAESGIEEVRGGECFKISFWYQERSSGKKTEDVIKFG